MANTQDPQRMQERLDELGDDIDATRKRAQDADLLPDPDEPKFYEDGDIHPEWENDNIAPG